MKIFWMSDSPFDNTGYSTQSLNILNQLDAKGHECHYIAHNWHGQVLPKGCVKLADGTPFNFDLSGSNVKPYAQDVLPHKIKQLRPNVFGILLDTFMLMQHGDWFLNLDTSPAKTLFYFPSDGGNFPTNCEMVLKKVNYPIAMSKYAQKQINDYFGIKTHYIPHAIDPKVYYPLPEDKRKELRKLWRLQDRYVVGIVARNQPRKMLDRAFKAFKIFKEKCPEAVLLLHTDPHDQAQAFDMIKYIAHLGLQNRVVFTGTKYWQGFTYQQMNEIYNLMDVHLNTTSGEGFGIPTIDAMACGVPSAVTDYTTTHELLVDEGQCGEPIKLNGVEQVEYNAHARDLEFQQHRGTVLGSWNVERGICDINHCVEVLEKLRSADLRKKYSQVGIEKVKKFYNWDVVGKQWNDLMEEINNE